MPADFELPTDSGTRRFRRTLAVGVTASALLHAAGVILIGPGTSLPGTGERLDGRSPTASEFRGMEALSVRASESEARGGPEGHRTEERERVAPRVSRPRSSKPGLRGRPVPVEFPRLALASAGASGGASAEDAPSAQSGPAASRGGEGSGGGEAASPGVPRTLMPQWSPPESVRGLRVTVRVEVDADGRPTGRVELVPPTPSEAFNRTLRQRMTDVRYLPLRRGGEAVKGWAEITFVF